MTFYEATANGFDKKWYPSKKPGQLLPCPVCNGTLKVIDARTKLKRKCCACKNGKYLSK